LGLLSLAAVVIVCSGIKAASPILAPTVFGAYLATVNTPIVSWLHERRIPLGPTVILVLIGNSVILAGFATLLGLALTRLSGRLPEYFTLLRGASERVSTWFERFGQRSTFETVDPTDAVTFLAGVVGDVAGLLWDLTLALLIAGFLIMRLVRRDKSGAPSTLARSEKLRQALHEMNRYIAIKTLTSMATGLLIGIWAWSVGADLPVLFGLIAFMLNYIPNLGSILAAVPAVGLGLMEYGLEHALLLGSGYVAVNVTIGNIIEPRIMGRALGLYPIVVLWSVVFWGWMLGVVGALLSALLTLSVKMLLLASPDLRPVGLAFGPRPPPADSGDDEDSIVEETMPQTGNPPSVTPRSERR
jgi:predicted PurR-regulated permease PerM